MTRRVSLVMAVAWSAALALGGTPEGASAQQGAAAGATPVASELVVRSCSRCHAVDGNGYMSRISYLRKTPEGWAQSVRRMVSLNDVRLEAEDAREIVRYLSNEHGLAPEELRPVFWEVERRHLTERPELEPVVRATCTACHTIGRIATQRRTTEEWGLIAETHRGLYPLVDRQVFRRGAIPEGDDYDYPVEAAVARLARAYPLATTAWTEWSANQRPAELAGTWAVRGYEVGRGAFYGTVTVEGAGEEFRTTARYAYGSEEGRVVERRGEATVYTGYQWRGRTAGTGDEYGALREVMFVERDWTEMFGRWFTGAYDELGVDVRLVRVGAAPVVMGTYPEQLRAGEEATVRIHGANLPAGVGAADVGFGAGVEVLSVEASTPTEVRVRVRVAADAREGARDVVVPGGRGAGALVVHGGVDYIKVGPHPAIARAGGANFAPGHARFEAVGYTDGPDGRRGTEDDVRIGAVPATWSLDEYPRTFDDDDVRYVGAIDARGRFTPAVDGPNADRSGNRNNIGEVWVKAEYRRPGAPATEAPLSARGFLVVSPPNYVEWEPREEFLTGEPEGGR